MNTNVTTSTGSSLIQIVLGIAAAIVIFFVLTNRPLPIITTDRAALIALFIIGFVMCMTGGIGKAISAYGWASPVTISGTVLGVLLLLLTGARLANINLPLIVDDRAAFIAVAVVGVVKVGISIAASVISRAG